MVSKTGRERGDYAAVYRKERQRQYELQKEQSKEEEATIREDEEEKRWMGVVW